MMQAHVVGNTVGSVMGYGHATGLRFAPRPSNREWLPAPAVVFKRAQVSARKPGRWLQIPPVGRAEDKAMGLLMLLAVTGLSYGFWVLLQFVENWAGIQAGISRFIE
jgi:hypothetical protein